MLKNGVNKINKLSDQVPEQNQRKSYLMKIKFLMTAVKVDFWFL